MSIIYFLDLFGSFAFALSGALMAIKKDMDLFGIAVLALVTAIGGGITRDMLLGNTPVYILNEPVYIYISIIAAIGAFLFNRMLFKINSIILVADALGLGTFVCIGVSKALEANVTYTGAVLLGLITAIVGGIIRDILANEIPAVLTRDFYAITCIGGGIVYTVLYNYSLSQNQVMLITAGFVIILRLLAIKFKWRLIKALPVLSGENSHL
ncbi:inner membrane protein [Desulfocucumis palustris]|uniref:Inner membrane protein n=1 Tax=Desulfocucumis palustris TaxID=1898651 RepID=A0A2L2X8X0_9FIRM|nr:trimeric intracellular cation channel family protein [Desulfocucumis palustris]GBF32364.1 inner membrane protein [Desulfocucumis palustris]